MLNDHINVIGLMSGTSLDGLDLSFVSFNKNDLSKYNIIHTKTFLYENKWIKKLKEAVYLNKIEVKKLDNDYAELLAYYVKKFIKEFSISKVDLISSHGHTVFHQPEKKKLSKLEMDI
jgi:anhydro-N-acetylmuramic acid kinase